MRQLSLRMRHGLAALMLTLAGALAVAVAVVVPSVLADDQPGGAAAVALTATTVEPRTGQATLRGTVS